MLYKTLLEDRLPEGLLQQIIWKNTVKDEMDPQGVYNDILLQKGWSSDVKGDNGATAVGQPYWEIQMQNGGKAGLALFKGADGRLHADVIRIDIRPEDDEEDYTGPVASK